MRKLKLVAYLGITCAVDLPKHLIGTFVVKTVSAFRHEIIPCLDVRATSLQLNSASRFNIRKPNVASHQHITGIYNHSGIPIRDILNSIYRIRSLHIIGIGLRTAKRKHCQHHKEYSS